MHHGPFGENLYAERSWVSRLLPAGFGLEFGQPTGGARVGIGGWVRAGWEGDSDVIGRGRVLAEAGDSGADPSELVGVFQVDRELVLPRPLPAGCDGTMAGGAHIVLGAGDQHILDAVAGHLPDSVGPVTTIAGGREPDGLDDHLCAAIGAALDEITAAAISAVEDLVASRAEGPDPAA